MLCLISAQSFFLWMQVYWKRYIICTFTGVLSFSIRFLQFNGESFGWKVFGTAPNYSVICFVLCIEQTSVIYAIDFYISIFLVINFIYLACNPINFYKVKGKLNPDNLCWYRHIQYWYWRHCQLQKSFSFLFH